MTEKDPPYRVAMAGVLAWNSQALDNFFRRMFLLPIRKTADEARKEEILKWD